VHVKAREGEQLTAEWSVRNLKVTVQSAPLERAQNRGLTLEVCATSSDASGNTPYRLEEVTLDVDGSPFVSASVLNQLRRDAVDRLQEAAVFGPSRSTTPYGFRTEPRPKEAVDARAKLHVLIRTPDQLEAAIDVNPASITLDYLDLYGLRPSVDRVKAAAIPARVASPRILKPGEIVFSIF